METLKTIIGNRIVDREKRATNINDFIQEDNRGEFAEVRAYGRIMEIENELSFLYSLLEVVILKGK